MGLFGSIIGAIGSAIGSIFGGGGGNGFSAKIAEVEQAMQMINAHAQTLTNALNGLRTDMQPLEDGGWHGAGFERFQQEFRTRVEKGFNNTIDVMKTTQGMLNTAKQQLEEADQKSGGFWDTIGDIAGAIFGAVY
jgi:WXG100 family type VII secretion target